jgi:hypothetical protein
MAPKGESQEDWFKELDSELEKATQSITNDYVELSNQKVQINKIIIQDFWRILQRFAKINVHFTMEPSYSSWAQFEEFPNEWKLKENFNFAGVGLVELIDRTQEQGRMGDTLSVHYYTDNSTPRLRVTFEYCEGEQYYKYAGWKRIFGQFVIFDNSLARLNIDKFHEKISGVVKAWYESHLRRNREILIKHLKDNYERGETFTQ